MFDLSMEIKAQLHRDCLLKQAEKYRLTQVAQAGRSGNQKPVFTNIRETFTSLGLRLKTGQVSLLVN